MLKGLTCKFRENEFLLSVGTNLKKKNNEDEDCRTGKRTIQTTWKGDFQMSQLYLGVMSEFINIWCNIQISQSEVIRQRMLPIYHTKN